MTVRGLLILIVVAGALVAMDALAFDGRYRKAALQQAQQQGEKLNDQIRYFVSKVIS